MNQRNEEIMKKRVMELVKGAACMIKEYKSVVVMGIYAVFYLIAFFYLEQRNVSYHVINFELDRYIPFCEIFVIPYFLWLLMWH